MPGRIVIRTSTGNWDIETFGYELHHHREVLSAVILGGYVNLHKSDLHFTQIIIHSLRWIADKNLTIRIVILSPVLQGSDYETTYNNFNKNHCAVYILNYYSSFYPRATLHPRNSKKNSICFILILRVQILNPLQCYSYHYNQHKRTCPVPLHGILQFSSPHSQWYSSHRGDC